MDKNQMKDPQGVSPLAVTDDEASKLRRENAALREDNEDLRASALWWKALYEEALRRLADTEPSPKVRISSRHDVHLQMTSPGESDTPRVGAGITRPF
jgi:hypothetical protein